jgi:hypothetical protein
MIARTYGSERMPPSQWRDVCVVELTNICRYFHSRCTLHIRWSGAVKSCFIRKLNRRATRVGNMLRYFCVPRRTTHFNTNCYADTAERLDRMEPLCFIKRVVRHCNDQKCSHISSPSARGVPGGCQPAPSTGPCGFSQQQIEVHQNARRNCGRRQRPDY